MQCSVFNFSLLKESFNLWGSSSFKLLDIQSWTVHFLQSICLLKEFPFSSPSHCLLPQFCWHTCLWTVNLIWPPKGNMRADQNSQSEWRERHHAIITSEENTVDPQSWEMVSVWNIGLANIPWFSHGCSLLLCRVSRLLKEGVGWRRPPWVTAFAGLIRNEEQCGWWGESYKDSGEMVKPW